MNSIIKNSFTMNEYKPFIKEIISILFVVLSSICFFYSPFLLFIIIVVWMVLRANINPSTTKRFFNLQKILPTSKIRSITQGLVELRGTAHTLKSLNAPMGKIKCIGYRYTIADITKDKDGREVYHNIKDETICSDFKLQGNTGNVEVKTEGIAFIDLPLNRSKRVNDTLYSQYLLQAGDEVLLIGKANTQNGKTIIEKDEARNMLAVSPFSAVEKSQKYRPLTSQAWIMLSIAALLIAFILIAPIRVEEGKVMITLSFDMLSWKSIF